jgi:membrane protease YdiL (CAAX protease family)
MALTSSATLGLTLGELGLRGDLADVILPAAIIVVFVAGVSILARSRHARLIADRRVTGLSGAALAFHILVRIPLGTGVTEEVVFRGVLFASWRSAGMSTVAAALCAAVAFGLWHISPTIIGVRMNDMEASRRKIRIAIAGAVVLTTMVGLGLTWFRLETGSLVGPMVLHAGINSAGAFAAVKAGRRTD